MERGQKNTPRIHLVVILISSLFQFMSISASLLVCAYKILQPLDDGDTDGTISKSFLLAFTVLS